MTPILWGCYAVPQPLSLHFIPNRIQAQSDRLCTRTKKYATNRSTDCSVVFLPSQPMPTDTALVASTTNLTKVQDTQRTSSSCLISSTKVTLNLIPNQSEPQRFFSFSMQNMSSTAPLQPSDISPHLELTSIQLLQEQLVLFTDLNTEEPMRQCSECWRPQARRQTFLSSSRMSRTKRDFSMVSDTEFTRTTTQEQRQ